MKKKIIYFSSLILTIALLSCVLILNSTYSQFASANVKSTISILSSDTFSGRLAGSVGNSLAAEVIKNNFISNGVKPYKDSYTEDFNTTCPVNTNTSPYLKIFSNGEVEEDLQYGVDFKEDMINFKNNTFFFSKNDKILTFNSYIQIITSDSKLLLYTPPKDDFLFRSSFLTDFTFDAAIMISENAKNKILNSINSGKEISIHVPFTNEEKTITNVVGMIEGTNKNTPPFIITAHFDHLGQDGLGNSYSGALDNASGTAFMLELQRSLSTFGKPDRDIIFVALNAEEFGLLGSKQFASNNYFDIKGAEVLNFDMIGSANYPITFMQSADFKNRDSSLLKSLQDLCKKDNIPYEVEYQDSSDHASFNNMGIDAVSFCHSDMTKIHTPKDTAEYIDSDAINTVYSIVDQKIKDSCYSNFTLFIYSSKSVLFLSILLGVVIAISMFDRKKSLLDKTGFKTFSLIGLITVITSTYFYFKGFKSFLIVILIFLFSLVFYLTKNKN